MKAFQAAPASAKAACFVAAFLFVLPFFVPHEVVHPGMNLFLAWTVLCVAAVLADRLFVWAIMCVGPLAMLALDWLQGPREDPFGFYPWGTITLFTAIAIVTAATGAMSVLLATFKFRPNPFPTPGASEPASNPAAIEPPYTLWQKLWWKSARPETDAA